MNELYKRLSIVFLIAFAIMIGCFTNVLAADNFEIGVNNLNNTSENSAKLGGVLTHPEKGWKRYDDTNGNLTYKGKGWSGDNHYYGAYPLEYLHWDGDSAENGEISFNFTGTSLRIISSFDRTSSSNLNIVIDGSINGSFSQSGSGWVPQNIQYEKKGLLNIEHSVKITKVAAGTMSFDAVDIDANGDLKPYSEKISPTTVLNIEPEKNKIHLNETVSANLTIDNIKDIAAEDVRITYDNTKLKFINMDEVDGIKLVKPEQKDGELRFILASKGVANVVNAKKALLKLNFKGIAAGDALVDVTKGRVSDGITIEKDLADAECGQATITIEDSVLKDVNNSGEFTLLDLAIDGRHYSEDPATLTQYNTDIVVNKAIDNDDLTKIGEYMLANPNYKFQ